LVCLNVAYTQDKHITYIGDIYSVSLKGTAEKTPDAIYKIDKGIHNIIVYKEKKAIFFKEKNSTNEIANDTNNQYTNNYFDLQLFDKKHKTSKLVWGIYNPETNSVKIDKNCNKKWTKITPNQKPELTEDKEIWYTYLESIGVSTEFKPPVIDYTDETEELKGYQCKIAYAKEGERVYKVWYTESMHYNWCFDDYRNLIPGTIIKIEYDGESFLELLSIEDLDYNKISVNKNLMEILLKKW